MTIAVDQLCFLGLCCHQLSPNCSNYYSNFIIVVLGLIARSEISLK
ncbi:hypothetical protein M595_3983 [Lyngbya aestuarii BL J]|uniref:Uncharacterized protein n=1 Tax=Lyngbya aestuarii BL J TaxID=1348334 RepID=U7QDW0_9CYAN|nr:hypothetical protein M595_3983 [Lyngbya aestuarii BL J]